MNKTQKIRVASYALITRKRKVLLCRISKEIPEFSGQWTLPGGGIEFGEIPEEAMIREVFEETGLRVIASEIATIDSIIIHKEQEDLQAIRLIYSATTETNKVRSETVGTTDLAQWHPIDECDTLSLVDLARTAISSLKKKESSDLYERS